MRTIKFRAFGRDGMTVVDGSSDFTIEFGNERPTIHMFSNGGDYCDSWKPEAIMQYTGLKDKNGVEIYEGDILEESTAWGNRDLVQVALNDDFVYTIKNSIGSKGYLFKAISDIDYSYAVIGNIWENGDLLK